MLFTQKAGLWIGQCAGADVFRRARHCHFRGRQTLDGEGLYWVSSNVTGLSLIKPGSDQIFQIPCKLLLFSSFQPFLALAAIQCWLLLTLKYILTSIQLLKAMDRVRLGDLDYQIPDSRDQQICQLQIEQYNDPAAAPIKKYRGEAERQKGTMLC